MPEKLCHCGRPLHYTDSKVQAYVEREVAKLGEVVKVTVAGRSWMVPRHYIALHGLTGADLPNLGFTEVPKER